MMMLMSRNRIRILAIGLAASALAAAFSLVDDATCSSPVLSTDEGLYFTQFNSFAATGTGAVTATYTLWKNPDFFYIDDKGKRKPAPDLSTFVLDLKDFVYRPGMDAADLVTGATHNGRALSECQQRQTTPCYAIGPNRKTGVFGVAIENLDAEEGVTDVVSVTFATAATPDGITLGKIGVAFQGAGFSSDTASVCGPVNGEGATVPPPVPLPWPEGPHGCDPSFWRNDARTGWENWGATGLAHTRSIRSVFGAGSAHGGSSLLQALDFDRGLDEASAQAGLLREATAAYLNASHEKFEYPRTPEAIVASVRSAIMTRNVSVMLTLADELAADNALGCPFERPISACSTCDN